MRARTVARAVFVIWACLGIGCAGWQTKAQTSLAITHEAAKAASTVGESAFDLKCSNEARKCKAANDTICAQLKKCEGAFKAFNWAVKGVHVACAAGLALVAMGDEGAAALAVAKAAHALRLLYDLARKHGVM